MGQAVDIAKLAAQPYYGAQRALMQAGYWGEDKTAPLWCVDLIGDVVISVQATVTVHAETAEEARCLAQRQATLSGFAGWDEAVDPREVAVTAATAREVER